VHKVERETKQINKKAMLSQENCAMLQLFFSV